MQSPDEEEQRFLPRRGRAQPTASEVSMSQDESITMSKLLTPGAGGGEHATPNFPRQRPRFATAQDLDDALLQAIEGKINRKNAWASKDASNLLEGITHTVESTLDAANSSDEYTSFAKVATVVEGCSKVWTSRVDSTYQRSNEMVRRLLRNEDNTAANKDCDEDGDGENTGADGTSAAERRRRAAQRRGHAARTLALDPSEINLDRKGRLALAQVGVSAQFRAITEKFDQGNAQGLLVHNTPLGAAGNFILDVDYSRESDQDYVGSGSARSSGVRTVKSEVDDTSGARSSSRSVLVPFPSDAEEVDAGLFETLELPSFAETLAAQSSLYGAVALENISNTDVGGGGGGVWSTVVSNRTSMQVGARVSVRGVSDRVVDSASLQQDVSVPENGAAGISEAPLGPVENDDRDDDWVGGGGDEDYNEMHEMDDGNHSEAYGYSAGAGSVSGDYSVPAEHVAVAARHLVSGVAELNALDGCLFSDNRLALEVENPTEWFPLAEPYSSNLLGRGMGKNTELLRLRREHRFVNTTQEHQRHPTPPPSAPKRARREKTITFDLPAELVATSAKGDNGVVGSSPVFSEELLCGDAVDSSALRQSPTVGKNMTVLGRELILGKSDGLQPFMQGACQRVKAQEAGILLREDPVPGETIPSYLPYPINMAAFFQPFSTPLMQWNLLRKAASARTLELYKPTVGYEGEGPVADGAGDMPAEFFHGGAEADDDYMGAGGYNDYDDEYNGRADDLINPLNGAAEQTPANFELAELARTSAALTVSSSLGTRLSGVEALDFEGMDPHLLAQVLQAPQAVLPSQIDVVKLRHLVWVSLSEAMKKHPASQQEQIEKSQRRRSKRDREELGEGADVVDELGAVKRPRLSEIVLPVLPLVPTVSATGKLSPAFLFFSMLFLANEHGVVLESVPESDDLEVCSVRSTAEAG
ncbi:putative Condensin complex subunit 2 [Trypanosoma vivax]|uniref:Condensin complex subunit 2 n=1 Tax=Trypanosoma vivax (strain Y486) TaxID=1055687 RepID=G0TYY5_TRYVY|nr:hypothetical protein TRVL_00127 [Trypanosoma vivax]KAH8613111.1 putative Condensin complex subunit 2 [Trypanosoma vivax]CCC49188.1 conserved hypothetical protein [Trypanosoma vivax Y486]